MATGNTPIGISTAHLLRRQLKAADQALTRLGSGDTGEALHDFRVAVRRIRSRLRLHRDDIKGTRHMLRDLRKLMRDSDTTRNAQAWLLLLDVLAEGSTRKESEGVAQIRGRLALHLRESADRTQVAIRVRYPPLRDALYEWAEIVAHYAGPDVGMEALFQMRTADVWRCLETALSPLWPDMEDEPSHHARLLAKRLRYLLESDETVYTRASIDGVIEALKPLQSLLGEWRDSQFFGAWLTDAAAASCGAHAREMLVAALREDVRGFAILQEHEGLPGLVYLATRLSAHLAVLRVGLNAWFAGEGHTLLRQRMAAIQKVPHGGGMDPLQASAQESDGGLR